MTNSILAPGAPDIDPGDPHHTLRNRITAALARLDDLGHADRIADHLADLDIRGVCGDPGRCAIAAYLDATIGIPAGAVLYVDHHGWDLWDGHGPGEGGYPPMQPTPPVVGRFIRRFDHRDYPDLHTAPAPAGVAR